MAGLGGQGVLTAGQLLTQTALEAGLEVSWYPSYSPEVRGGEATCTVIMADRHVGSPISGRPHAMVLMAPKAVEQHLGRCAPDGIAIINTSLGEADVDTGDTRIIALAANEMAVSVGSERAVNLVMLGVYLAAVRPELLESAIGAIGHVLPERHHRFIPMNEAAIRRGAEAGRD